MGKKPKAQPDQGMELLRASELGKLCNKKLTKQTILHYRNLGLIEADAMDHGEYRFARWRTAMVNLIQTLKEALLTLEEIRIKVWPLLSSREDYERLDAMKDGALRAWLDEKSIGRPKKPR